MVGGAGGMSVCCSVRATAASACASDSSARVARRGAAPRSYAAPLGGVEHRGAHDERRAVAVALEHRVHQRGQAAAVGAHELERDLRARAPCICSIGA